MTCNRYFDWSRIGDNRAYFYGNGFCSAKVNGCEIAWADSDTIGIC
jgi:hypothetical protein